MSLRKKHRGRYECVGRNSEGQIDYATRVYVKGKKTSYDTVLGNLNPLYLLDCIGYLQLNPLLLACDAIDASYNLN